MKGGARGMRGEEWKKRRKKERGREKEMREGVIGMREQDTEGRQEGERGREKGGKREMEEKKKREK